MSARQIRTVQVASQLADKLVAMGFEEMEAAQFIQPQLNEDLFGNRPREPLPPPPSIIETSAAVAEALQAVIPSMVQVQTTETGVQVTVTGLLPTPAIEAVLQAVPKKER